MSDQDLAAQVEELRARQERTEEHIRVLADAVQRLADETRPNPVVRTTQKVLASRLDQALGRGNPHPPRE
jgi:hypothetical protein